MTFIGGQTMSKPILEAFAALEDRLPPGVSAKTVANTFNHVGGRTFMTAAAEVVITSEGGLVNALRNRAVMLSSQKGYTFVAIPDEVGYGPGDQSVTPQEQARYGIHERGTQKPNGYYRV
jgi:hypothetical protein